jgi:hypothetical protein
LLLFHVGERFVRVPPRLPGLDPVQDRPAAENRGVREHEHQHEREEKAFALPPAQAHLLGGEHDVSVFGHGRS